MKKFLCAVFAFVLFTAVFAGCETENAVQENNSVETTAVATEAPIADEVDIIVASENNFDGLYVVGDFEYDLNGDGEEDVVALCADAEISASESMSRGDGHTWVLYAEISGETYLLFNEYLSFGGAYFEVSDYYYEDGSTVPNINLVVSTGSSFKVFGFAFSDENGGFEKNELYNSSDFSYGGTNRVYTMLSDYE